MTCATTTAWKSAGKAGAIAVSRPIHIILTVCTITASPPILRRAPVTRACAAWSIDALAVVADAIVSIGRTPRSPQITLYIRTCATATGHQCSKDGSSTGGRRRIAAMSTTTASTAP